MAAGTMTPQRATIEARHLRTDRWWASPLTTAVVLVAFVIYSTWRAFANSHYYAAPYVSPFYSPCIAQDCTDMPGGPDLNIFGPWWGISPAIIVLIFPLGFRLTCYYYRKAYYRSIWQSPTACAVGEPHKKYTGETRFPLIMQNIHRYFFYFGLILNVLLTWDAVLGFRGVVTNPDGTTRMEWGHMGLGTVVLLVNAALLWLYSVSCHSCRHAMGGRLKHFSKHPLRYRGWTIVSKLNARHMMFAWISLIGVALTDFYVFMISNSSTFFSDPKFF